MAISSSFYDDILDIVNELPVVNSDVP